ncbi:MAG: hypothetical protein HY368_01495 [Candidatus Aenigmarchaeota archaeon]|nr:hypothetical protein [Candidatus Aenigmarchaeota archaeon]
MKINNSCVEFHVKFPDFNRFLKTMRVLSSHNLAESGVLNMGRDGIEWTAVVQGNPKGLEKAVAKIKKSGYARSVAIKVPKT